MQRDGAGYAVHATANVAAEQRIAWETLTDYEHLRDFVPDIESSRVVSREGNRLVVEHTGSFHLFVFSMPVRVRLAVEHQPYERVLARTTPGLVGSDEPTLRSFSGRYRLTVLSGNAPTVRVDYDARFELADSSLSFIEGFFGQALVRHGLRRHFDAMLAEIERRQAVASPETGKR